MCIYIRATDGLTGGTIMADTEVNGHSGAETATTGTNRSASPMVLRTVFIESRQDQFLRDLAAEQHISKGELIRRAINSYLAMPAAASR